MAPQVVWSNGRRVLVTGCTGLLGSWLSQHLTSQGANVVGIAPQTSIARQLPLFENLQEQLEVLPGEIEDYDFLTRVVNEYGVETIFHLAAQPILSIAQKTPRSTFETNIRGAWNVLEAARVAQHRVQVILTSSVDVYGDTQDRPCQESMAVPLPSSPYGTSKFCSELIGQTYYCTYGVAVCFARCCPIYGGGDLNFSRIIPGTILSTLRDEPPVIKSDGTLVRDYLFVEDAARAFTHLAEKMASREIAGEIFNFGSGRAVSLLQLVRMILTAMGRQDLVPLVLGQPSTDAPIRTVSFAKAEARLDWSPSYSLEDGLKKTVEWYQRVWQMPTMRALFI